MRTADTDTETDIFNIHILILSSGLTGLCVPVQVDRLGFNWYFDTPTVPSKKSQKS